MTPTPDPTLPTTEGQALAQGYDFYRQGGHRSTFIHPARPDRLLKLADSKSGQLANARELHNTAGAPAHLQHLLAPVLAYFPPAQEQLPLIAPVPRLLPIPAILCRREPHVYDRTPYSGHHPDRLARCSYGLPYPTNRCETEHPGNTAGRPDDYGNLFPAVITDHG